METSLQLQDLFPRCQQGGGTVAWMSATLPASLTEKKPRTSGLRRDISSMSLRVSSTSKGKGPSCGV